MIEFGEGGVPSFSGAADMFKKIEEKKRERERKAEELLDLQFENARRENTPLQPILTMQEKPEPIVNNLPEKPLDTREKSTLLKIIAVMAKKGYGNNLSKPHSLANEISEDAASLGIDLGDPKTIAGKLKEAKKLFDDSVSG